MKTQKQAVDSWAKAAAAVLTRTDRILSGQHDLTVDTAFDGPAPAWTDGKTITIKTKHIGLDDPDTLSRLMGLNYHELSHVLYTPRTGPAFDTIQREGLFNVYNMAEDQRIETMFSATYPPAADFFIKAILDLILTKDSRADLTWPLVAGRKFVPAKLRKVAAKAYSGDAAEWLTLINEYLTIRWTPQDEARGLDLLRAMKDHLADDQPLGNCGGAEQDRGQVDETAAEQAQAQVAQQEEDEDIIEDEDPAEDSDSEEAEEADEDTDAEETGEGPEGDEDTDAEDPTEDTDSEGESDESEGAEDEGESDGETDPEGAEGAEDIDGDVVGEDEEGAGQDASGPSDEAALDEAIEDAAEQAEKQMQRQAQSTESQIEEEIEAARGKMGEDLPKGRPNSEPVTPAAASLAHDLESVLSELRAEVDPGWISHTPAGRISVQRYLTRQPWEAADDLFDEWQPGAEDALDIEVAVLIDGSSSMGYNGKQGEDTPAQQVAEGAWALKRALEAHNIRTAVIGFNNAAYTVYGADDEADGAYMPQAVADGGTYPTQALTEVARHFNYSSHRRRILVVLTDGEFFGEVGPAVRSIDAELKVLLRFGMSEGQDWGFDEVHNVDEIDGMAYAVRDAIVEGVRRRLASI